MTILYRVRNGGQSLLELEGCFLCEEEDLAEIVLRAQPSESEGVTPERAERNTLLCSTL